MTGDDIKAIRYAAGLSQEGLARLLRVAHMRTVRRWENDEQEPPGTATIVLEMMAAGELPARFYPEAAKAA